MPERFDRFAAWFANLFPNCAANAIGGGLRAVVVTAFRSRHRSKLSHRLKCRIQSAIELVGSAQAGRPRTVLQDR
jgi:hypothetical protein